MFLLNRGSVAWDAKVFEALTLLKSVGAKLSFLLDLKFVGEFFHLVVIVDAYAFQELSFKACIVDFLVCNWLLLFNTLQKEVHAVLKRYGVARILVKAQRLETFILSIVVIDILQVVLIV